MRVSKLRLPKAGYAPEFQLMATTAELPIEPVTATQTEAKPIEPDSQFQPQGKVALYLPAQINNVKGLYRSVDAGATWIRINDDQHQYGGSER